MLDKKIILQLVNKDLLILIFREEQVFFCDESEVAEADFFCDESEVAGADSCLSNKYLFALFKMIDIDFGSG